MAQFWSRAQRLRTPAVVDVAADFYYSILNYSNKMKDLIIIPIYLPLLVQLSQNEFRLLHFQMFIMTHKQPVSWF